MNVTTSPKTLTAGELLRLAAVEGFDPPPLTRCRLIVAGDYGVGKSCLLASFPRTAYVDLEGGAHSAPGIRATRFWCPVLRDEDLTPRLKEQKAVSFKGILKLILADARSPQPVFEHVALDTIDKIQQMYIQHMAEHENIDVYDSSGDRNRWGLLTNNILSDILPLSEAGYGWSIASHIKWDKKKVAGQEVEELRTAMAPGLYAALAREAEYVFDMERGLIGQGEVATILKTTAKKLVTKGLRPKQRVPLPEVIRLPVEDGYGKLNEVYSKAVDALRNKRNTLIGEVK